MPLHSSLPPAEIHSPYAFVYPDKASRVAAALTSADVNKVALQVDTKETFVALADPATGNVNWSALTSAGGAPAGAGAGAGTGTITGSVGTYGMHNFPAGIPQFRGASQLGQYTIAGGTTGKTHFSVFGENPPTTGKHYFEIGVSAFQTTPYASLGTAFGAIGISTLSAGMVSTVPDSYLKTASSRFIGTECFFQDIGISTSAIYNALSQRTSSLTMLANDLRLGFALDLDAGTGFVVVGTQAGAVFHYAANTAFLPTYYHGAQSGDIAVTVYSEPGTMLYTPPVGYTEGYFDQVNPKPAPTFVPPVYPQTLNPAGAVSTGVTVQGSTVHLPASAGAALITGGVPVVSGKWYFEAKFTGAPQLGLVDTALSLPNTAGSASNVLAFAPLVAASTYQLANAAASVATTLGFTAADVVGFAIDATLGKVWISKNGVFAGYPASDYAPDVTITVPASGVLLAATSNGAADSVTLNIDHASLQYTPPDGFHAGFGAEAVPSDFTPGTSLGTSALVVGDFRIRGGATPLTDPQSVAVSGMTPVQFGGAYFEVKAVGTGDYSLGVVDTAGVGTWFDRISANTSNPVVAGEVFGIAVDMLTQSMWVRDNGVWQGGDPVNQLGGIVLNGLAGGVFPSVRVNGTLAMVNLITDANSLTYAAPAGFSAGVYGDPSLSGGAGAAITPGTPSITLNGAHPLSAIQPWVDPGAVAFDAQGNALAVTTMLAPSTTVNADVNVLYQASGGTVSTSRHTLVGLFNAPTTGGTPKLHTNGVTWQGASGFLKNYTAGKLYFEAALDKAAITPVVVNTGGTYVVTRWTAFIYFVSGNIKARLTIEITLSERSVPYSSTSTVTIIAFDFIAAGTVTNLLPAGFTSSGQVLGFTVDMATSSVQSVDAYPGNLVTVGTLPWSTGFTIECDPSVNFVFDPAGWALTPPAGFGAI